MGKPKLKSLYENLLLNFIVSINCKKKPSLKDSFPDLYFTYCMNLSNSALNFGSSSINKA